jgi:3-hydroxyacyl-CoA dehydrogenase
MTLIQLRHHDGIAVVTVDNPPVNALSHALRQDLSDAVSTLDRDPAVQAVVLVCAGRTFIAGADVSEFGHPPQPPHLPDLVSQIEAARKPWIAAIHGSALGGGFEIALGCRFRLATESASLGLPEVNLGVIPGASGTVRTPRLIGVAPAVTLVTTGKPVKARAALDMGLVDAVTSGDLLEDAIQFARDALTRPLPQPISQRPITAPEPGFWEEERARLVKSAKGADAPLRALDCLRRACDAPFDEALAFERQTFLELRASPQAAALRHVFFAERAAPRPAHLKGISPLPLKTVGVIGGGTMGAGIVAACQGAGLTVTLIERDADALAQGVANIARIHDGAVQRGRMTQAARDAHLNALTASTDYAALAQADLLIEAVFEKLDVKRDVFAKLARHARADAVLATNTSYLDPREIAAGLPHPERFIGLHFFSPANVMRLLEIVPIPQTAPEPLATGFELARRLGKIPVQSGICDGFIGNRILKRTRAEAEALLRQGVPIAAIDAAMRGHGLAMGPFEAQDLGGLDIAYLQREGARAQGQKVPETLGDILVRAGRKGQKTGGGWYDYPDGSRKPQPSDTVAALLAPHVAPDPAMDAGEIVARITNAIAAEGQAILDEGIAASATDIDLVKIHGYGYPRWRGGPMFYARRKSD